MCPFGYVGSASVAHAVLTASNPTPTRIQATFTRLTDEEREALRRRGGCFYCRKDGHRFFECPERKDKGKEGETQVGVLAMLIGQLKAMGTEERAQALEALKDF